MRKLLIATLSILLAVCGFAQSPSETLQGFYINHNGDTIKGSFPGYRQREFSPEKIEFTGSDGKTIQLTPSNARQVEISNLETWIAYHGPRITSPMDLKYLSDYNSSPVEKTDTVTAFLRLIGKMNEYSFYILNDKLRRNFYYSADGSSFVELRNHMYKVRDAVGESKVYIQQLMNLLNPDRKLRETINRLDYTEQGFGHLFKNAGYTVATPAKKPWFTVFGGLSASSMNDVSNFSNVVSEFNTSVSPVIGIDFNLPVDRNFNKYYFYLQLKAFQYNHSRKEQFSGQPSPTERTIKSLVVAPGLHFGFNFINKKLLRAYVSPGIALNVGAGSKQTVSWKTGDGRTITYEDSRSDVRAVPELQAGISLSRIIVWAGYSLPAKTNLFYGYQGVRSSMQLAAGVKF